jgi:hypothetical protein
MSLIPEMSLSNFRKLRAGEMRRMKSFVLTVEGEYLGTVIIPQTSHVKCSVESLGQLSNTVGGRDVAVTGDSGNGEASCA